MVFVDVHEALWNRFSFCELLSSYVCHFDRASQVAQGKATAAYHIHTSRTDTRFPARTLQQVLVYSGAKAVPEQGT